MADSNQTKLIGQNFVHESRERAIRIWSLQPIKAKRTDIQFETPDGPKIKSLTCGHVYNFWQSELHYKKTGKILLT